ncbi:FxsA family protein [Cohaesibacter celericrescens]|uniref:Membrane protein FxsA n=1 Tax=Cohaesibacter celericrescens TaxID=2067669 RepID=A0A2N5XNZ4_9HYPH|nr:FxsA family protein [Cohaesibacter celericrescens]PLW76249.1 membrane protein FxsA [Cohaesibacter celericrescens]
MRKSLFPFVPFLLLIVPILEIGVFIILGGQIGVINTLLGIVLTAFIGTILLRQQGFALLGQAQNQMNNGNIPGRELAHGVMLLAAGLLLLTPGFVTDTFGFLLLVPAIRSGIFSFFKSRMTLTGMHSQATGFSSDPFGGTKGTYYESYTYSTDNAKGAGARYPNQPVDPSIIDLDEEDFNEVADRDAIEARPASENDKKSPWGKP